MAAKGWVQIDESLCKGCDLCVHYCPVDVLALDSERLTPQGYHPAVLAKEGCTGCSICAIVCPEAAITVYREVPQRVRATAAVGGGGA